MWPALPACRVWQEALLSVCRQENRSFVSSGKVPTQWYPDLRPQECVFPPQGHTGGHTGDPVALLPLQTLTRDFFISQKPKQSSSSEAERSRLFLEFKNTFRWAIMR